MRYIKTPDGYADSYRFAGFKIDGNSERAEVKGYLTPDSEGLTIATFDKHAASGESYDNLADAKTFLAELVAQLEEDLACK